MTTNNSVNDGNLYSAGDGKILIARASGQAIPANITAGANVTVTNSANGITIAASGGSSGAYTFISSATATNSASLTFSGLSSTYIMYQIIGVNILVATAGASVDLHFNSDTSNHYTYQTSYLDDGGTGTGLFSNGLVSSILFIGPSSNTQSAACTINIYNPSSSAAQLNVTYQATYTINGGGAIASISGGGCWFSGTPPATSVVIAASTGNITSGTFYLYGITG